MGVPLLIAIVPPPHIAKMVVSARTRLAATHYEEYGLHAAHITLFVNTFRNYSDVAQALERITRKQREFRVRVGGINRFVNPSTDTVTVVHDVTTTRALADLQRVIFKGLAPLRTPDQAKLLLSEERDRTEHEMTNIRKYGYDVSPREWKFHMTVAQVRRAEYQKVKKELEYLAGASSFMVRKIAVLIHLGTDGFQPFSGFVFGK